MYHGIENNYKPQFVLGFNDRDNDLPTDAILMELANLIIENTPFGNAKIQLIAEEWDIRNATINGQPLLIYAIEMHNFEACKIFIRNKVNIEELGNNGVAEDGTAMHLAAITPDIRYLDLLAAQGANINAQGYGSQKTPLAESIRNCFFHNADRLMEYNANLNIPDVDGRPPIYDAIKVGSTITIRDIIEAGGKIDVVDKKGLNPLHYNMIEGDFLPFEHEGQLVVAGDEITKLLIYYGCYTDTPDNSGNHPLHYACAFQRRNAAHCLVVDNKVDVNAQNDQGTTALHWAVGRKDLFLMCLLLSHKANPNLKDDTDSTPLHFAAQLNFIPGIRLLLKYGAIKTISNIYQQQPIDLTSDIMAANLLAVPNYGMDLNALYDKAPEHVKRAAFRQYMIAKIQCDKINRPHEKS